MAELTRLSWITLFLSRQGYPANGNNVLSVATWIASEFGAASPLPFSNNPLATTQDAPGAKNGNSAGVKIYPDFETGLGANIATLQQNHTGYDSIRAALSTNADPEITIAAISNSVWGSHPSSALLATVRNNPTKYMEGIVSEGDIGAVTPGLGVGFDPGKGLDAVGNVIGAPLKGIEAVGAFFLALTKAETWIRIGQVVGGVALLGVAIYMVDKDIGLPGVEGVTNVVEAGAKAAAL